MVKRKSGSSEINGATFAIYNCICEGDHTGMKPDKWQLARQSSGACIVYGWRLDARAGTEIVHSCLINYSIAD